MSSRSVSLLAIAVGSCIAGADARAQCEQVWLPGPTVPGLNGGVTAMTKWDPDGAGPLPPQLVVGGSFTSAGSTVAGPFAVWDGAAWKNWSASGFSTCKPPTCLATYQGKLIAAAYSKSGSPYWGIPGCGNKLLFEWLGSSWAPLGGGVWGTLFELDSRRVNAVTVFQDDLVVGGDFTSAAGLPIANDLARWNGTSWAPLGSGSAVGTVTALAVYQGQLIAGGSGIARWNGAAWLALGGGVNGAVRDLIVHDSRLVVAGEFSAAGGLPADNIARWDGASWSSLGGGTNGRVNALAVYNGQLIIAGDFTSAGEQPTRRIARWNGTSWRWLGAGIGVPTGSESVASLEVYKGLLMAGGTFTSAGGVAAYNIAAWNGSTGKWSAVVPGSGVLDGDIHALGTFNGEVVAAGGFTTPQGKKTNVVRRDGASWKPLGAGLVLAGPGQVHTGQGLIVRPYGNELIVAGAFRRVDGVQALNIARWNGAAWLPLGLGTNQAVLALAEHNGDLIAGGKFGQVGLPWTPVRGIARWDGGAWHPLGAGITGVASGAPSVNTLAVYDGDLIAGGNFTKMGGQPASRVARWDGASWTPLGSGLDLEVRDMAVFGGDLYAGVGTAAYYGAMGPIYRWNGVSWWYVTPEFYGTPRALTPFRGELYAAGGHDDSVLRFSATQWSTFGGGLGPIQTYWSAYGPSYIPPTTRAMTVHTDELYLAGSFSTAGGQPSIGWARWGCVCYPDCNNDHVLSPADVVCFNTQHAAAHPYADCDHDGRHTFADLTCFQLKFAAGCP